MARTLVILVLTVFAFVHGWVACRLPSPCIARRLAWPPPRLVPRLRERTRARGGTQRTCGRDAVHARRAVRLRRLPMAGVAGALAPRAYLLAMLVAAPAIRLLISEFQFAAIG